MYRYRLEKIKFNEGTEIEPKSLTVIVGSNNSGKSKLLKDLRDLCTSENPSPVVLTEIEHTLPSRAQDLTDSYDISLGVIPNQSAVGFYTLNADMTGIHNQGLFSIGSIPDPDAWFRSTVESMINNWESSKE
jgi:energy-coupling factor transporter ATP-binding protein EcfA2